MIGFEWQRFDQYIDVYTVLELYGWNDWTGSGGLRHVNHTLSDPGFA